MSDAKLFNYRCPYTDDPCFDFQCIGCPVEEEERRDMEELNKQEEAETETWNGIHAQITAPKGTFDRIWKEIQKGDGDD